MPVHHGRHAGHEPERKPDRQHGKKKVDLGQKKRWQIASGIFLLLAGVAAGFYVAPYQEARTQKVIEQEKDQDLAKSPALEVHAEQYWDEGEDSFTWVFPRKLSLEDMRPIEAAYDAERKSEAAKVMTQMGGERTGMNCGGGKCTPVSRYQVTLTGNRSKPVHIRKIRAHILSKEKSPGGTLLVAVPGGGGPSDTVFIDLDSEDRQAVTVKENEPTDDVFTIHENRFAEEGEPLSFVVIAGTKKPVSYEWELVLDVSHGGKSESVKVRLDKGKPFKTTFWNPDFPYGASYELDPYEGRISLK